MTLLRSNTTSLAARFALATVLLLASIATALQFLRSDLDPVATQLSSYLVGDYGVLLQASYYLLGAGIVALAWAGRAVATAAPLRDATALLFALAGIALPPVAVTQLWVPDDTARLVHGFCAQSVFLCISMALLLQAIGWRQVPLLAARSRSRVALAIACVALLAVNLARLPLPRGATQKILIAVILVGLAWSAASVARAARA